MGKILWNDEMNRYVFECPGCGCLHFFDTSWKFNGDFEKPTVSPSILVFPTKIQARCHFFIREGKIQFLDDCAHELKGQTVEIPDFDETKSIFDYE